MTGRGEDEVAGILEELGVKFTRQKEFRRQTRWVQVDFYLPEVHGVIEVEYRSLSEDERIAFLESFDLFVARLRVTVGTCYFCRTIRALIDLHFKGLWPKCKSCDTHLDIDLTNDSS